MKHTIKRSICHSGLLLIFTLATGLAMAAEPMQMMSKGEVKELLGKSNTPEDHHRLAAYFNHKADMMEAEAVEHDELAAEYMKNPGVAGTKQTMSGKTAGHCKYFSQVARKAEAEDRALAAAHESMASKLKH